MSSLSDVLGLCPPNDEAQRRRVEQRFRLPSLDALRSAVVFGTGALGESTARRLTALGLEPHAFVDNDARRWHRTIAGLPVLPPSRLDGTRPTVVASKFVRDIWEGTPGRDRLHLVPHYVLPVLFPDTFTSAFHRLAASAVNDARSEVAAAFDALEDDRSRELFLRLLRFRITLEPADLPDPTPGQYFPGSFWRLLSDESFVDAGACGGDTLVDFLAATGGDFAVYHAFEPDGENLLTLRRRIEELTDPRLVVHPVGLGERRQRVEFAAGLGGESRVASGGAQTIEVVSLDEEMAHDRVTTIKVDVEGYEREVLRGAAHTIARQRPKLAVSAYHRLEDLWEIPSRIVERYPFYRLYLRHHTPEVYDTVLYCTPRDA